MIQFYTFRNTTTGQHLTLLSDGETSDIDKMLTFPNPEIGLSIQSTVNIDTTKYRICKWTQELV